ncbi:MAG: 30S ribosomal protein S4 [Planctomycetes bacterium SM23_32]|nr:MAG: 30S ribosomal protein S4 [Planctomycetes bacterium SM23_32]
MARYTGSKCKLCRREGVKLFLKGARCHTAKCPIEGRTKRPGMHGWRRGRPSDYAVRLREKQKCKRYYGVLEAQFLRYFEQAQRGRGNTGENLLSLLERRLDNVLTVCGFAISRAQARQMITHRHVQVNGRTVDVPNYLVDEGDVVRPELVDATLDVVRARREQTGHPAPGWLEVNDADLTIRVLRLPVRDDVTVEVEEGLVVELCSR